MVSLSARTSSACMIAAWIEPERRFHLLLLKIVGLTTTLILPTKEDRDAGSVGSPFSPLQTIPAKSTRNPNRTYGRYRVINCHFQPSPQLKAFRFQSFVSQCLIGETSSAIPFECYQEFFRQHCVFSGTFRIRQARPKAARY